MNRSLVLLGGDRSIQSTNKKTQNEKKVTTIVQNIPMPTHFLDLPAYLIALPEDSSPSMAELRQLHHTLKEDWEKTAIDSSQAGHPYWSICTGKTACNYTSTGHGGSAEDENKIWTNSD